MASLDQHIRTPDPEAHARLPFRADCRACRSLRLTGTLPPPEIVPRRAKAGIVAGALAASWLTPGGLGVAQASPGHGGERGEQVLPPGGVGDDDSRPTLPPSEHGEDDAPGQGVPPVAAPETEVTPPAAEPQPEPPSRAPALSPRVPEPAPSPPADQENSPRPDHEREPNANGGGSPPSTRGHAPTGAETRADESERPGAGHTRPPAPQGSVDGADPETSTRSGEPAGPESADRAETTHVVRPGESLWVIAERRLADGASDAEIAKEVNRLWELNDTETIRTGNPDLIFPGQELRL